MGEKKNTITTKYNQAAYGHTPEVLDYIRKDGFNIATLHDPLSAASKTYLNKLRLKKIWDTLPDNQKYFRFFDTYSGEDNYKHILQKLPEGRGRGRETLVQDLKHLNELFEHATGYKTTGAGLYILKTTKKRDGFLHCDPEHTRGVITLKGPMGTIWQPNHLVNLPRDNTNRNYGKVIPAKGNYEEIAPQDFALFNCRDSGDPLVHGSPTKEMCGAYRLIYITGYTQK